MQAIGDHLGHRKADTTRVYAKVDLGGLRQVAHFA
jgi:integrase/recombinase XerD